MFGKGKLEWPSYRLVKVAPVVWVQYTNVTDAHTNRHTDSAGLKYVEALGRIIIGGPYPPSNAIIYMHLQL